MVEPLYLDKLREIAAKPLFNFAAQPVHVVVHLPGKFRKFSSAVVFLYIAQHRKIEFSFRKAAARGNLVCMVHKLQKQNCHCVLICGALVRLIVYKRPDKIFHKVLNGQHLGYRDGVFAPGFRLHTDEVLRAGHNLLRAHGAAVRSLRESCPNARIGIVMAHSPLMPADGDKQAALDAYGTTDMENFVYSDCYWLDPIVLGKYPSAVGQYIVQRKLPLLSGEDMRLISQPIDFIGGNTYQGNYFEFGSSGARCLLPNADGYPRTPNGWKITPEALYWAPYVTCTHYGLPYYVCENGTALNDYPLSDGRIHDSSRIEYFKQYLAQLKRAKDEGLDIRGYFAWSLMDNFEWASGYRDRFGLIYVDFKTKERIIKDSGYWYGDFIREQSKSEEQ